MGFKQGLIHVHINSGNIDSIQSEIRLGNSDMTGNAIYRDNMQLIQTISNIKKIKVVRKGLYYKK